MRNSFQCLPAMESPCSTTGLCRAQLACGESQRMWHSLQGENCDRGSEDFGVGPS